MSEPPHDRTPSPSSASATPAPMTFSRSSSRRELFESTAPYPTSLPPSTPTPAPSSQFSESTTDSVRSRNAQSPFEGGLSFDVMGRTDNVFFNVESEQLDVAKYRRIAENTGLYGEQADTAVSLAIMTPRSARVHIYSQLMQAVNLISKFREVQVKNWEIPAKVKTEAHTVVRLALIAPIPHCYKDELPLLVLRVLIKGGTLSRDFESKHHQRADVVMREVARHAGHVRSEIKQAILASIAPETYLDILTLSQNLSRACGKDINVTKELLGAVAYLRAITALQAEDRTPAALKIDEKVWWGLLEQRVRDTRARHKAVDARLRHLHDWLDNDQEAYGRVDADKLAALRTDSAPLQAAVFEAQRKGPDELKREIARTL